MGNAQQQKWSNLKKYYVSSSVDTSYFATQQNIPISQGALKRSYDFAFNATKKHYHSIGKIWRYIHPLTIYLTHKPQVFPQIQTLLAENRKSMIASAMQVLKMQDRFLQRVNPINVSYFHFMRRSDIYINYVAMKYVIEVGVVAGAKKRKREKNGKEKDSVFDQEHLGGEGQRVRLFGNLVNWLYQMISYKCSAIYIQDETIDHLIEVTFLVVCGLLTGPQNPILGIHRKQREYIYNQLLYIVVYIFCPIKEKNLEQNLHLYDLGAAVVLKVISNCEVVNVSLFAPSYWYIDMFGLVQSPTVKQIMLLLSLQIIEQALNSAIQGQMVNGDGISSSSFTTITIFAHLMYTLVLKYSTTSYQILDKYLNTILPNLPDNSIARAFLVEILQIMNSQDQELVQYLRENRNKGYCLSDKYMSLELVRKNWSQWIDKQYFDYFVAGTINKPYTVQQEELWDNIISYNVDKIQDRATIEQQMQIEPQKEENGELILSQAYSSHQVVENNHNH